MQSSPRFFLIVVVVVLSICTLSPVTAQSVSIAPDQTAPGAPLGESSANIPGDEYWDDIFTSQGVSGPVYAVLYLNPQICIGGDFHQVGSVAAENVACWSTTGKYWYALGSGVSGPVYALAIGPDGNLYAGGQFSQAGSAGAQNIARYNFYYGRWEDVGGISGPVNALLSAGNYVYAGGQFYQAGYASADNVARFDTRTQTWSALAIGQSNGVSGPVYALALGAGDIYVGGTFLGIGGVSSVNAVNIARWNATSKEWSEVNGSVGGPVHALQYCGSEMYVGGQFGQAGSVSAFNIASWNPTTRSWSDLGQGASDTVEAITCVENRVYAGGKFTQARSAAANHVARWNTTSRTWAALGSGTSGDVYGLVFGNYGLYAGGFFSGAGATGSQNFALYTGDYDESNPEDANWDSAMCYQGRTNNGATLAIQGVGNILYYGGEFTSIGGIAANHLARYDSIAKTWSPVGAGLDGPVYAIAVSGNDLYVGGSFSTAGGNPASRVARWNSLNQSWEALGSGLGEGHVTAIAVSGSSVFVGGIFTTAGGVTANNVARWDTTTKTWNALGEGALPGVNGEVKALAAAGSDLYVGGTFTQAQGQTARYIARWNGSAWSELGGGVNLWVDAVVIKDRDVYIGGDFSQAGGSTVNSIARWDGTAWHAFPGLYGDIYSIAFNLGDIYAAGNFHNTTFNSIARWDGNQWLPLGSGLLRSVNAVVSGASGMYIGGDFLYLQDRMNCRYNALWKTRTSQPGSSTIYLPAIFR